MFEQSYSSLRIGDSLPVVHKPAITRTTLALFCGASNDHNPIHIDSDAAKAAGMTDVFAHGMLIMAYLGQVLTNWVSQANVRRFSSRFNAVTHIGDEIACRAIVTNITEEDDVRLVTLRMEAMDQKGEIKLVGEALVAV